MKSIFFKVFLLIGILGLIILYDVANANAQSIEGVTAVTTPDQYFVGSNFTLDFTVPDIEELRAFGEKCLLVTGFTIDGTRQVGGYGNIEHAIYPTNSFTGQAIATTTSWTFDVMPNMVSGWLVYTGDGTLPCNTNLYNDYTTYYYINPIAQQGQDGSPYDFFILSTETLPTSTASTITTSTTQIIENPLQNIYNGLILFFIMLFGFIFYFKK